jgi:hypothetical protein
MTSPINSVIDQQTRWAKSQGFELTSAYMTTVSDNLRKELSRGALKDFERGSGGELRDRGIRPSKMRALRSSAALVANVFDYWRTRDPSPLQHALSLNSRITAIGFEEHFSTGLRGNPPNVDVVLTLDGNKNVAIESKFTEWLSPRERTLDAKYFPDGPGLWTSHNLPKCQALADQFREVGPFKHLDVPLLLKHVLGLSRVKTRAYELLYLYFSRDCPEARVHSEELARFQYLVGDAIRFRAMTYEQLFDRLEATIKSEDASYLEYLQSRYIAT